MKKKFLSLIMALAMVLSLAVPAFATETTTSGDAVEAGSNAVTATTEFGSVTATPTVDVTLPTGGVSDTGSEHHVLINPYRLAYTRANDGGSEGSIDTTALDQSAAADTNPQVISAPLKITNKTNAPMKIGMNVKAEPSNTDVKIAAKTMAGKETDKSVFLFAELYYAGTSQVADWTDSSVANAWTAEADFANAAKLNEKCFPQVIATQEGKPNDIAELVPAASATTPNYIYFKVLGTAASNPTKAWTSTDTVAVQIVFTFTPVSPYKVNCYKSDGTAATTANYTVRNGKDISNQLTTTAVMNMPVWIKAPVNTHGTGTINTVTVTDMDGNNPVTPTKVDDTLYWFKMPAYNVKLVVSSTEASAS